VAGPLTAHTSWLSDLLQYACLLVCVPHLIVYFVTHIQLHEAQARVVRAQAHHQSLPVVSPSTVKIHYILNTQDAASRIGSISTPHLLGGQSSATPYGSGGGKVSTISSGQFSGRSVGGGTCEEIYGTR
jgi:hypothetical protein